MPSMNLIRLSRPADSTPAAPSYSTSKCLDLDGVNEYLIINSNPAELNFESTSPYSVSCWVYPGSSPADHYVILDKLNPASVYEGPYRLLVLSGANARKINFQIISDGIHGGGNYIDLRTTNACITYDAWNFIVVSYDGSRTAAGINIYVDAGAAQAKTVLKDTLSASSVSTVDANVGRARDNNQFFKGRLRHLAIWSKQLSAGEITSAYGGGSPPDLSSHSAVANLVSWWRMGDSPDAIAANGILDSTANVNHMTPTNMESGDIIDA